MAQSTKINCPKCGHEFNVEDVLAHQIEEKYRTELSNKISEIEGDYKKKESSLLKKEDELKLKQAGIDDLVAEKLKTESVRKEQEIKKRIEEEYESRLKLLTDEKIKTTKQIQELQKVQLEKEQLKAQLEQQKITIETEFTKKFTERLKEQATVIRKNENERVELQIKEKEEVINTLKKQLEEAKQTTMQGSERLQGEVQELALEEILTTTFPFDLIEPVEKGIRGADIIHTVRNKIGIDAGKIVYESKRTKVFSNEWLSKLKSDAIAIKGDVFVIVTETMPEGIDKIGMKEGVWICTFHDFKGLVLVLRESLIRINEAFNSQTNKGEKMQMLYDYLMSNEFIHQVSAIVEGFNSLQDGYMKEKKAMERIWKEREKQLEKVLLNTNHFIGSVKGIGGSSMSNLKLIGPADNILELQ